MAMNPRELGLRLRLRRHVAEMKQSELAERAKINRSKLSLAEKGEAELSELEWGRIQKVLDKKMRGQTVPLSRALTPPPVEPWDTSLPDVLDDVRQRKFTRLQSRLTQTQLAQRTGIPQSRLSLWEQGRAALSDEELKAWLRETAVADPWFRLEVESDAGRELLATVERLRQENTTLRAELNVVKSNLIASEEIAALRFAALQELAARLERLQSPLIKDKE